METQQEPIEEFFLTEPIAMMGVSRNPKDFSRKLWSDLRVRRINAIPVHLTQTEIDGVRCFPTLQSIPEPVGAALLVLPKSQLMKAILDCKAGDIRLIWIYGIRGKKDVPEEVLQYCENEQLRIITGYCPYMFLPETTFIHRFHASICKVIGCYPR